MRNTAPSLLIAIFLSASAQAEWTDAAKQCASEKKKDRALISICTKAVDSGLLNTRELANTLYNRARAFAAMEKYNKAIRGFGEAILLHRLDPAYYLDRASAQRKLKKYDLAIKDYTTAIDMGFQPVFGGYFNRGVAHHYAGNKEAALADFKRANMLEPENRAVLNALKSIYGYEP